MILAITPVFSLLLSLVFALQAKQAGVDGCQANQLLNQADKSLRDYNNGKPYESPQARVYRHSQIILSEIKTERKAAACAQFLVGSGLAIVTAAVIISAIATFHFPGYAMDMISVGGLITAVGLMGYIVICVRYNKTQRGTVEHAYDELAKALYELEYVHNRNGDFAAVVHTSCLADWKGVSFPNAVMAGISVKQHVPPLPGSAKSVAGAWAEYLRHAAVIARGLELVQQAALTIAASVGQPPPAPSKK